MNYLTTLDLDDEWLDALAKACPDLQIRRHVVSSPDEIDPRVWAEIEVLHTSSVFPAPGQVPRLRWIQLDTSGVEHVMTEPVWASDVEITTLGGIAPVPMAEFAVMSLLALAHHQPLVQAMRRDRSWPTPAERLATLTPLPVDGATATIVGYGRIGREVARLLHALGVHVIGVRRRAGALSDGQPTSSLGGTSPDEDVLYDTGRSFAGADEVEVRGIDELSDVLPRTDYLVVIVPRTPATIGLIATPELTRLKPGACVINVSRGDVVDEAALLAALDSRRVRYAAVDVFETEPLQGPSVWWDHPHTLLSPHVAGLAPRYREQVLDLISTNVVRYQKGLPLLNRADRAAGY